MADRAKTKEILTLTIVGAAEHRGHPMAHALAEKLRGFLQTFAGFERARIGKRTRQTDFEIVLLEHNSPAEIGMNPIPRVPNYAPDAVVLWTLDQWDKIARGEDPDRSVSADLVGDVADLSGNPDDASFSSFYMSYGRKRIELGAEAEKNATAVRDRLLAKQRILPWMMGQSLGTLTGELKSVLDANNERQIVIVPPVGPKSIQCNFTEGMRDDIQANLFKFVRITGILHYDRRAPFPYMVDLSRIERLPGENDQPHVRSGFGLFASSHYENESVDWL